MTLNRNYFLVWEIDGDCAGTYGIITLKCRKKEPPKTN